MLGLAILTVVLSAVVVLWAMIRTTSWQPIPLAWAIPCVLWSLMVLFVITIPQVPLTAGWRIALALLYAGFLLNIFISVCEYLDESAKKSPQ